MVLTVICSFGCGSGTTFTLILTGVVNPGSTRPITNSFTIYSFYLEGVNEYKVDESIVTTVANLGLVPNSFVSHATSSGTVITGDITSYTTVVRIRNPIPASGKF